MRNEQFNIQSSLLEELDTIVSEGQNPHTMDIDLLDTLAILHKLNDEDHKVPLAVRKILPDVAKAVDVIVKAFKNGGRLVYIGAGTSGRLGVLDAVECPPTFSVSDQQVVGILAGGESAMYKAVEGAEDDGNLAVEDLQKASLTDKDVLVGIAASGRTPYVIGALKYAKQIGASSIGVTCNPNSAVVNHADIGLCAVVGPEALTGSTRLKSGTAQKLILNMLTTASMIRCGKSYRNLMVDMNASNEKLHARAVRIVMQATDCDYDVARAALDQSNQRAKLAILVVLTGVSPEQGEAMLEDCDGFLRKAVQHQQGQA